MKDDTILPIIFTVALSIGIALFSYFLLIHFTVDQQNFQTALPRGNNLLLFYKQPHNGDIYILGSSYVNEGIDAYIVEDWLKKININRSVYILGVNGDVPLQRVVEIDNIIRSKPKMVIIGLSYRDLTKYNNTNIAVYRYHVLPFLSEKTFNERKDLREEFQPYLNDDQLMISQNSFEYFFNTYYDKRKFLVGSGFSSVYNLLFNKNNSSLANNFECRNCWLDTDSTNFKDPWSVIPNQTKAIKIENMKPLTDNFSGNIYPIFNDLNPQKRALLYTIHRLQNNNISVIIIWMPIDPLMSEKINESTRQNVSFFLNSTGVSWYDYEQGYPSEYFFDYTHMNLAGRTDFSPKVATIIADNLINGE